tara:strand:- start:633 stop:1133 length:501 start_codon:yes stop_codon:yes gene_type:complete
VFAIWYLFDEDDESYLSTIISNLAKKYDAPSFTPHITAYGLVNIDLKTLDQKILESIPDIQSFIVERSSINFSNNFWKSFFVEILSNKNFIKINNNLTKKLSKFSEYSFSPHISLLYKHLEQSQKQFLTKSIDIKKNFRITGMGIQKFSQNIDKWKLVKSYHFNEI